MEGALREYRRKRDFKKSPEPAGARARGAAPRTGGDPSFVVQLHHASHRHFDFRLEIDGTLRSWAIPKGPSLDPSQKRLAVQVEDHPLSYGSFEGDIPKGHYGAGHVDIWDEGTWTVEGGNAATQLKKGHLAFVLHGQRLKGRWSLVRTHLSGRQPQWLLLKTADEAQRKGDVADDTPLKAWAPETTPAPVQRGKRAAFPKKIGLQLARLTGTAPAGADWDHEVKYDGYRILIYRNGKSIHVASRNGQDYTAKLPAVVKTAAMLPCKQCVLDAELIATDAKGRSSFDLLQKRLSEGGPLDVVVFDLLYRDGHDLRDLPLQQRRENLQQLLPGATGILGLAAHIEGNGAEAFKFACKHGLEGIVSKSRDAPYREGRHGEWLKTKCSQSDEFVIVGYTQGKGSRKRLGSLLLARPAKKRHWAYVGRVGSGLGEAGIKQLLGQLRASAKPVVLDQLPTRADLKGAQVTWVKPTVVVEVAYRAITSGGLLRQASLKGLRPDKPMADLKAEAEQPASAAPPAARKTKNKSQELQSVTFTHPDRVIFEKPRVTKADLGAFYTDIADLILPELVGRPLSLMRCPDGIDKACFFQKHRTPGMAASVKQRGQEFLYIEDLDGLLALVQMNVIEFHPWGSTVEELERPDRLVLDLDPAEDVPWSKVVAAARRVRGMLEDLSLKSFVRTSGGKGLHVVLPLTPQADWGTAKEFTHAIARTLAQQDPENFVDVATKAKRGGKIFVDYLRNARGATSVASYSLRARTGAPLAMPLDWDDLKKIRSGSQYTFANARRHIARRAGDPWATLPRVRQTLPHL